MKYVKISGISTQGLVASESEEGLGSWNWCCNKTTQAQLYGQDTNSL